MIASAMGWVGTVGSICAYLLLSRGRWDATSLRYSVLNLVAGVLAGTASALYGAWPSVGSNVVWCAIAAHSAATTLRARRSRAAALSGQASGPEHTDAPPPGPRHFLAAA